MTRFVDIEAPAPRRLRVRAGDVLRFAASGGRIEAGEGVVEPLGPFVPGVIGLDDELLSPQGGPAFYVLRAVGPGKARLTLFTSRGGFEPAERREIDIVVE